ncbi:hypothetical protein KDH_73790 [Dictyobacter sp. S3.2.2.5]|uniref:Transmembrane protein n=1 Tax=Dictyobacter halimunensis TaxID=3026934 RepID=A0ABQ6G4R3_9CHLR|nr:hypothetical protein KDH_73790 [Dictyobacter sp. S3.2.2.5]
MTLPPFKCHTITKKRKGKHKRPPPNVNRRVGSTFNGRPGRERQRQRPTYPAGSASHREHLAPRGTPGGTFAFGFVCGTFLLGYHVSQRVYYEKRYRGDTWAAIAGARGPVDR